MIDLTLLSMESKSLDDRKDRSEVTEELAATIELWLDRRTMRPSWSEYFVRMAQLVATRATCTRKHVGAVLVDPNHRVISTGYNGSPSGMPQCIDDGVGCQLVPIDGRESCIRTLHAESNALDYAGWRAAGCTMYTTVIPCFDCAKRIVNAGVIGVYYLEYYESRNTHLVVKYFDSARVTLYHVKETGDGQEEISIKKH